MTEFLILDGVDDFPLLAIGMAPVVLTAALVLTVPNARLSSIAFQVLVFSPVILSPANPQHYSAEAYLFSSVIVITSVILLFVLLRTLFPTSDALLRHWYLTSARAEMHDLLAGNRFRWHDGEALFRELTASGNWPRCSLLKDDRREDVRQALDIFLGWPACDGSERPLPSCPLTRAGDRWNMPNRTLPHVTQSGCAGRPAISRAR